MVVVEAYRCYCHQTELKAPQPKKGKKYIPRSFLAAPNLSTTQDKDTPMEQETPALQVSYEYGCTTGNKKNAGTATATMRAITNTNRRRKAL
jgi:hypothetical protein